jgi:uncharacterized membrane protein YgcG
MRTRPWSIGAFGVLAALATISANTAQPSSALRPGTRAAATATAAPLRVFGVRGVSAALGVGAAKFDGALNDLVRHAGTARQASLLTDLQAMSPGTRIRRIAGEASPLVLVDAVTRGDPQLLKARLVALGMRGASVFSNDVGGWLPISQLAAAAAATEVHSMRAAMPRTRAAAVTSQGDFAQRSDIIRSTYPTVIGTGVTVGVLSDSFNCYAIYEEPNSGVPASGNQGFAYYGYLADYATDISTANLPAGVNVLSEPYEGNCLDYGAPQNLPFTDEGRAMLQIVHDVAPGASLAFYTADNSEADFANGILALAAAGAKVEADDSGYFDEPMFQDGLLSQAIDTVEAEGVAYFSAAGNGASLAYENTTPNFPTVSNSGPTAGELLLNFDASGNTTTYTSLPVTIASLYPGDLVGIVLEWDQPYVTGSPNSGGATSQLNLCVSGSTSQYLISDNDGNTVTSCTGLNKPGSDPVQVLILANPANAANSTQPTNLSVYVSLAAGSQPPGRIKLAIEDSSQGSTINALLQYSSGPTIQGHPAAAGAMAVGAAFFAQTPRCRTSPAVLEYFSSQGGDPILFSTSGARMGTPIVRTKPDIVGPDGVNTTFFGYPLAVSGQSDSSGVSECQNNANYPSYFGTSAATPHLAAVAALMMQANPALTPTQIYTYLRNSASPMPVGTISPNDFSGWGFVQADMALAAAGGPSSSSSSSSSSSGGSSSSSSSSGSSSSGGDSGSGSSKGGGGAFDALSLVSLVALALARRRRRRVTGLAAATSCAHGR